MITIKNHGTKPNSQENPRKFSFRKHWTFKKVETTKFSFLFLCLHIGLHPFLANFCKSMPLKFNREPCWFYDSLGWIKIIKAKQMCFITTWTDIVASVIWASKYGPQNASKCTYLFCNKELCLILAYLKQLRGEEHVN